MMKSNITLGELEDLTSTLIGIYEYGGQIFYANGQDPLVPTNVNPVLIDIEGLSDYNSVGCLLCDHSFTQFYPALESLVGPAAAFLTNVLVFVVAYRYGHRNQVSARF